MFKFSMINLKSFNFIETFYELFENPSYISLFLYANTCKLYDLLDFYLMRPLLGKVKVDCFVVMLAA